MTFAQFISILRARWKVVALVLGLVVATTLVVSLLLPKQYDGTASVVVDFKPDPISAAVFGQVASPAVIATQVDVIKSDRVGLAVARMLKLTENPAIRQQWQDDGGDGTVEQWLLALFSKSLSVEPSRDSNVIYISYRAPDPKFAAGMANAFAKAYMDTALELRTNPARQFTGFFEEQSKKAREELERAQSALSEFQKENGIVATDERLDIENARLVDLNTQLTVVQSQAGESAIRRSRGQREGANALPEVLNSPAVAGLQADVNRAEAGIGLLTTRLGENHPQVIEARAQLTELRAKLAAETDKAMGLVDSVSAVNNAREAEIRAALNVQRDKIMKMKSVRDRGMVLLQDVSTAQRTYEALTGRQTQSSLESQATQSNVGILTEAVPPVKSASPRILLNTVLAAFLGSLLAIGTAVVLELMDRRVRSFDDVVTSLNLPVIGSLPKPGAKRWAAGKALAASAPVRLLGAAGPAAAKGV